MFNKEWYSESIFKHFDIKFILSFCIFLIAYEIFRLLYFGSTGKITGRLFSATLIIAGIFFLFQQYSEEF